MTVTSHARSESPYRQQPVLIRPAATITRVTCLRGEEPLAHGEHDFAEVLQAARTGEPWAFARLYADVAPAVNGYLRAQRAAEPEDLTSEVFLGVFRGLASFEGSEQQFRSWVFTIAHRRLQDERRRAARRPHFAVIDGVTGLRGGDVEQEALDSLGEQWVIRISEDLSAEQRTVLLLRTVADLTAEEVAQITGKTVGAVRALQRRALEALRRKLARKGVQL
jgi:RNA polymerase sigma factor (sigma-70 family)